MCINWGFHNIIVLLQFPWLTVCSCRNWHMWAQGADGKCVHYNSSPDYLWLTEMGDTAGFLPRRLGLFLWALLSVAAENMSNDFGFIRFEKGEIFWKKTKGTAEGTSKDLDNSVIKLPCANRLVILYPFVYIVLRWMNSRSINYNHLNGFIFSSRCIFSLNMFLGLKSVAKI